MRLAIALAVLSTACARQVRRPPIPDVASELDREIVRVDLLAGQHMADTQLHAQATAYVLAKAQRRASASRVARRTP